MLDVHPPHHTPSTWRDFLLHIATIVVGLLIAIGLEQTVEYLHHRHLVHAAHDALAREQEDNLARFHKNVSFNRRDVAMLHNNLLVLHFIQQHPATSQYDLPGILYWGHNNFGRADSVWKTIQATNVTAYMPPHDVELLSDRYSHLAEINDASEQIWHAVNECSRYMLSNPDPTHLSPIALAHEIDLTEEALVRAYNHAIALENIGEAFPEYAGGPTSDELYAILNAPDYKDPAFARALAQTNKRIPQSVPNPTH